MSKVKPWFQYPWNCINSTEVEPYSYYGVDKDELCSNCRFNLGICELLWQKFMSGEIEITEKEADEIEEQLINEFKQKDND